MNLVLDWVKKNVFIVVFVALMIAALTSLPIISSNLNAGVQENVKKRASKASALSSLATDLRGIPGLEPTKVVVNKQLLEQYERAANAISEDAKRVVAAAIEHNRKGRGVLLPELLPDPPMHRKETLPPKFHALLMAAYTELLDEVRAGQPPDDVMIQKGLDTIEIHVRAQTFLKEPTDPLEPEEQAELKEKLAAERLSIYGETAAGTLFYTSRAALAPPGFNPQSHPSLTEIYQWQWELWIAQDVLWAFHDANVEDGSVLSGPVKQVVMVRPWTMPSGSDPPSEGRGSRRGSRGESETAVSGGPADPKKPVPVDFTDSFTGRRTNPLYDVQMVSVTVIVDTNRIPQVLDALGKRNFMTVTNLRVAAADPYDHVKSGFLYGQVPVSVLEMDVETIWLREWTTQFMPEALKRGLGIPGQQATSG